MWFFKNKLKLGDSYACVSGDHAGKLLVYVDENKSEYVFMTIPTMDNLWVPKDSFDNGKKNGIIEYVERVPKYVRTTVKAQFNTNKGKLRAFD